MGNKTLGILAIIRPIALEVLLNEEACQTEGVCLVTSQICAVAQEEEVDSTAVLSSSKTIEEAAFNRNTTTSTMVALTPLVAASLEVLGVL